MPKIFRLPQAGKNIIQDWESTNAYGQAVINSIPNANATSLKEITSIPSPFARMELAKSAFREVIASNNLDGNSIYHKIVSDTLDVGEIFFNIDKLAGEVRILVWDTVNDLTTLLNSDNATHRLLGETLRLYLTQDAQAFNFNQLKRIYLLDYIGPNKPKLMNIIGATSPATLFFTSANDLAYVSKHITFGNDQPFDAFYQPLYKRDFDYQCWWYSLRQAMPNFATLFPEVDIYLTSSYQYLANNEKTQIDALNPASYNNSYDPLFVGGAGNLVEVLGFPLRKKKPVNVIQSDFEIASNVFAGGKRPLVLPVDTYTRPLKYVTGTWNQNTKVPYNDSNPLNQRRLPGDGTQYPYLTIGDFLEDYILFDGDKIDSERFFNGTPKNNPKNRKDCYLLPLRKEFFDYFTVNELTGVMPDGKPMFELVDLTGGVRATLRIPIQQNEYITYERLYFEGKNPAAPNQNEGCIKDVDFSIAVLPGIRFPKGVNAHYRVAVSEFKEKEQADLKFFKGGQELGNVACAERNLDNKSYWSNKAYIVNDNVDYMVMKVGNAQGIVVPRWQNVAQGNAQFSFAIDFGTTNTHVECSVNGDPPEVFTIEEKDRQISVLNDANMPQDIPFARDYTPKMVGQSGKYGGFPIRTVLSEGKNTNWQTPVFPMANTNIPFNYEKAPVPDYDDVTSDLKWANDANTQKRVEHYLDALFFLLRNKVLLNGGNLNATRIVWFYPASMTEARYNLFKGIWDNLYQKYFGDGANNVVPMSESIAPSYFYGNTKGASTDVVSIDIGGGTTDIVVVENRQPNLLTSFRFAANSIFGDDYGFDADTNGFVQHFTDKIADIIQKNQLSSLETVQKNLLKGKKSTDIVSFFFSLAENEDVKKKNISLNFSQMLANSGEGKYMFIFFYAAIIYHIASLLKAKGRGMPRFITFSGMGSKVLNILTPSDDTLSEYTKVIFTSVYGQPYPEDGLTLIRNKNNPKEATCKGGLINVQPQDYAKVDKLKETLLGEGSGRFVKRDLRYGDVKEELIAKIVEEVKHSCTLFVEWDEKFSYANKFGADRLQWETVKKCCKRDVEKFLKDGLAKKNNEIETTGAAPDVEETLFFYPLVGILNNMAKEVL